MDKPNFKQPFNIIRVAGIPQEATTSDGHKIHRSDKIFVPDFFRFVVCAPYDNHFLYEDPEFKKGTIGRWFAMCTCGSTAVVVGHNAYKEDSSPTSGSGIRTGEMLVCYHHAQYGKHADGTK